MQEKFSEMQKSRFVIGNNYKFDENLGIMFQKLSNGF
jgi:hypothetical protein